MSEMLVLEDEDLKQYTLSQVERSYECAPVIVGASSRGLDGTLCQRLLAYKTTHNISWDALTWDDTSDGVGLSTLKQLVALSGTSPFTLYVTCYGSETEEYSVMFDLESFQYQLSRVLGAGRRYWQVKLTLLEV